ncbi:MAG: BACON domain-containing protein [Bacteroidales bacterium]|nr:BACON domain-containing protein [Bacteroidales bacterium]
MKKISALLLSAAFVCMVGCGKDDVSISVTPGTLDFTAAGGSKTVKVTVENSDAQWTNNVYPEWIKVEFTPGSSDVTIKVDPNSGSNALTFDLEFIVDGKKATVTINVGPNFNNAPDITGQWELVFFDGYELYPESWVDSDDWSTTTDNITRDSSNALLFYIFDYAAQWGDPKLVIEHNTDSTGFVFSTRSLGEGLTQVPVAVRLSDDEVFVLPARTLYHTTAGVLDGNYTFPMTVAGSGTFDAALALVTYEGATLTFGENGTMIDFIESPLFTKPGQSPAKSSLLRANPRKAGNTNFRLDQAVEVSPESRVGNLKDMKIRKKR